MNPSDLRRFMAKVEVDAETGCWRWTADRDRAGYGRFCLGGRLRSAHRVAYETLIGPIPDGLSLDHVCANEAHSRLGACPRKAACEHRGCVNPGHLEIVDHATNVRRGWLARKGIVQRDGHGNRSRYVGGCRCELCRGANNAYARSHKRLQRQRNQAA